VYLKLSIFNEIEMKSEIEIKKEAELIVLFDGVCALCDRAVQFLLNRDKRGVLKFAPLQGPTAAAILKRHPEIEDNIRSIILVQNHDSASESVSVRSQAILDCLSALGGIWQVVSGLRIVPLFLRDWFYNFIARKRYRWFGKDDECIVPPPEMKERFLE